MTLYIGAYIDGLVQERRNSIANALELRLSCTNPSIYRRHQDSNVNLPQGRHFHCFGFRFTNLYPLQRK